MTFYFLFVALSHGNGFKLEASGVLRDSSGFISKIGSGFIKSVKSVESSKSSLKSTLLESYGASSDPERRSVK